MINGYAFAARKLRLVVNINNGHFGCDLAVIPPKINNHSLGRSGKDNRKTTKG